MVCGHDMICYVVGRVARFPTTKYGRFCPLVCPSQSLPSVCLYSLCILLTCYKLHTCSTNRYRNLVKGSHGEDRAWACNGSRAEPQQGTGVELLVRGKAPLPEKESLLAFWRPKEGKIWPLLKDLWFSTGSTMQRSGCFQQNLCLFICLCVCQHVNFWMVKHMMMKLVG